jgi:hypothetical protein
MHNMQGGKFRRDHAAPSDEEVGRAISKVLVGVSGIAINLISGYVEYGWYAMDAARVR